MSTTELHLAPPEVSVVIPSYNSGHHILDCLGSIFSQQTMVPYEVIIIDSSEEDILPLIKERFPAVRFYHLEGRIYPGTARNIGAGYAQGRILAFTDSDCVADPSWLDHLYRQIRKKRRQVIGGSILNGYPANLIATAEYLMEFGEFLPEKNDGHVEMIPSCNFGIEKDLFNQAGGFPDFITAEDVMFSNQLKKIHAAIYFDGTVKITHFNRREMRIFLTKQKELGIGSCLLRRSTKIRGHFLAKHKLMAILIPFIRLYTVWRKVLVNDWRYLIKLIEACPIIFLGLISYSYGFWRGYSLPVPPEESMGASR